MVPSSSSSSSSSWCFCCWCPTKHRLLFPFVASWPEAVEPEVVEDVCDDVEVVGWGRQHSTRLDARRVKERMANVQQRRHLVPRVDYTIGVLETEGALSLWRCQRWSNRLPKTWSNRTRRLNSVTETIGVMTDVNEETKPEAIENDDQCSASEKKRYEGAQLSPRRLYYRCFC